VVAPSRVIVASSRRALSSDPEGVLIKSYPVFKIPRRSLVVRVFNGAMVEQCATITKKL
jgi:hypothetical protein